MVTFSFFKKLPQKSTRHTEPRLRIRTTPTGCLGQHPGQQKESKKTTRVHQAPNTLVPHQALMHLLRPNEEQPKIGQKAG